MLPFGSGCKGFRKAGLRTDWQEQHVSGGVTFLLPCYLYLVWSQSDLGTVEGCHRNRRWTKAGMSKGV